MSWRFHSTHYSRYWIWQSPYLKVLGTVPFDSQPTSASNRLVLHSKHTLWMPAFRSLTTAYYHTPYNTHKNRMYSNLTNEEATVLPFILHHQNKLNMAQDCCCVILSTILLEKGFFSYRTGFQKVSVYYILVRIHRPRNKNGLINPGCTNSTPHANTDIM